jgi:2-oxoglutarate dehydrogenase E2 component (dihydrolipoamide succinyltransferase)
MADVTLPQLGETVTEGTITRWFKKVGDVVRADEPLFEVSTDKVDTEVPSPIAGTLTEIRVQAGETVPVACTRADACTRTCAKARRRADAQADACTRTCCVTPACSVAADQHRALTSRATTRDGSRH